MNQLCTPNEFICEERSQNVCSAKGTFKFKVKKSWTKFIKFGILVVIGTRVDYNIIIHQN